ncbi:hypothetical protein N9N03_01125 [Chlamydiia bacterium]|nr:hypothetical protein [Chlamydiia bacterium]
MRKVLGFIWSLTIFIGLGYVIYTKETKEKSEYIYFRYKFISIKPDGVNTDDLFVPSDEENESFEWDHHEEISMEVAEKDPSTDKLIEINSILEYVYTKTIIGKAFQFYFEPQELKAYLNGHLAYDINKKIDEYCQKNQVKIAKKVSALSLDNIIRHGHHSAVLVLNDQNEVIDFKGIYNGEPLSRNMRLFNCKVLVSHNNKYEVQLIPNEIDLVNINESIPNDTEFVVFKHTLGKNYQYIGFADSKKKKLAKQQRQG